MPIRRHHIVRLLDHISIPLSYKTFLPPIVFLLILGMVLPTLNVSAQQATAEVTPEATASPLGTITGKVTNGTANSTVPPDLVVTIVIDEGNASPQQFHTPINPDGSFHVDNVPIIADANYVAATLYHNHVFNSAFIKGSATPIDLPITIYEPTDDASVVSVKSTTIQVSNDGTALEFTQVINLHNSSDHIFTSSQDLGGGRYTSVSIPLPPGAQVVSTDDPTRYIIQQDKFTIVDTQPVFPGDDNQILVIYIIPYNGTPSLIEQPFNYPFNGDAKLLLWPETLGLTSTQFAALDKETANDREYQAYSATLALKPGEVIRYEISGSQAPTPSPMPFSGPPAANGTVIALVIIAVLAIAVVVILFALRSRQSAAPTSEQLIDALNRQIEALDRQHAAGELNHDLWHRQRAPLQARLDQLMGVDEGEES